MVTQSSKANGVTPTAQQPKAVLDYVHIML